MQKFLIILIIVALYCGAIDTFLFSVQNHHIVTEGESTKKFYHPFMQVAMRYVSNFGILVVYGINLLIDRFRQTQSIKKQEQNKREIKISDYLSILIPTIFDYIANLGYYMALNFLLGSVYQMLRGGNLIATYLLSYAFLNHKFRKNRTVGCIIMFFGLLLIGLVNLIISSSASNNQQYTLLGYGLVFFSLIINSLHFIYQQYLAVNHQIDPFVIIGLEGVYGNIINIILLPILSKIPCFLKQQACVIQDSGTAVVQDFSVWFRQITSNPILLATVIIIFFSMAMYNVLGVIIAKYSRSLTRSTIDVSRAVLVWIAGISLTTTIGVSNAQYQFQSLSIWQIIGQLAGFALIILGNLIYFEIVKSKCLQQEKSDSLLQDQNH